MCGIAGWLDLQGAPDESAARRLGAMCDLIRHRGPDDAGAFIGEGAALGVRRLSIVDLVTGNQPMASADGRYQIVFNGEIFNHAELRAELEGEGATFRTRSDTEVVLRLFEMHGKAGLSRLNGMFGIAIFDTRERRLTLVRDRMGVKPLYYHFAGGRLTFASEIKAILAVLPARPAVDEQAIWDYLTFRFVPMQRSIWQGIAKLPPGHLLEIAPGDPAPRVECWWSYPGPSSERPSGDPVGAFRAILEDAVRLRMLADVPVGILLSGGLDSSVVAALAARQFGRVATFSVAFSDADAIDERGYARMVARSIGSDHHEVEIGEKEFVEFLPKFVYLTDEPLADLASIPLYYVSALARRHVTVVLSGEGSDEILGGYSFDQWARRWDGARRPRGGWRSWLAPKPAEPDPSLLDLRAAPVPLTMTNYYTSQEKLAILRADAGFPDSLDDTRAALERFGDASPLAQALAVYCRDWLVEDLLMKADKMSMANSLELRTPFLDYRLVEFAAGLPDHWRVGPERDGTYATKRILRHVAAGLVPETVITRPKMGFPVPVYQWLSGRLKPLAHDLLDGSARLGAWCERAALDDILVRGTAADAADVDRHRLWNLMVLELWMREWL